MQVMGGFFPTELFVEQFNSAEARGNPIVLDLHCPGADLDGFDEAYEAVRNSKVPVIGYANSSAQSGGLWLFAHCDQRFASPTAMVGSLGVRIDYMHFPDAVDPEWPVKKTITSQNAQNKLGGESEYQRIANECEEVFIGSAAVGYGIDPAAIAARFGNGSSFVGRHAEARGMLGSRPEGESGIMQLQQVINQIEIDMKQSVTVASMVLAKATDVGVPDNIIAASTRATVETLHAIRSGKATDDQLPDNFCETLADLTRAAMDDDDTSKGEAGEGTRSKSVNAIEGLQEKGYSLEEIGDIAGVTGGTISAILKGEIQNPSDEVADKLVEANRSKEAKDSMQSNSMADQNRRMAMVMGSPLFDSNRKHALELMELNCSNEKLEKLLASASVAGSSDQPGGGSNTSADEPSALLASMKALGVVIPDNLAQDELEKAIASAGKPKDKPDPNEDRESQRAAAERRAKRRGETVKVVK